MTNDELFLLVLLLIYLSECFVFVNRGGVGFRSILAERHSICHPSSYLGNENAGLIALSPLPLGTFFVCYRIPFSVSPNGIYSYVSQSIDNEWRGEDLARFLSFDEIQSVRTDEKVITINDVPFITAGDTQCANVLGEFISSLLSSHKDERAKLIRAAFQHAADAQEIRDVLAIFNRKVSGLRIWSLSAFALQFVALPIILINHVIAFAWPFVLLALVIQMAFITSLFHRLHKLYCPAMHSERWIRIASMALLPPALIRSVDSVSVRLFVTHNPLAVAEVLCNTETLVRFARRLILDLRFPRLPICPTDYPPAIETEEWHRKNMLLSLESYLKNSGFDLESITCPPLRDDAECLTYCPRCDQQYVLTEGVCSSCGGIPLVSFDACSDDQHGSSRSIIRST